MPSRVPPLPPDGPPLFRVTVHGTVFGERGALIPLLEEGDALILLPDPPGTGVARVWVHRGEGDLLGHLPPEVEAWLAPWLRAGGRAVATVVKVQGAEVPSYRRVVVEVACQVE